MKGWSTELELEKMGFGIEAKIGEDITEIQLTENKRQLPTKTVSTKRFISALTSFSGNEDMEETPILPGDYGTKKILRKGSNNLYFLYTTPPRIKTVKYLNWQKDEMEYWTSYDDYGYVDEYDSSEDLLNEMSDFEADHEVYDGDVKEFDIYVPSLVWMLHIRQKDDSDMYRLVADRVFAKKGTILSMDDVIYDTPTDNVYGRNNVCWGDISIPNLTVQGIGAVDRLYFDGYTNTELTTISDYHVDLHSYRVKSKFYFLLENSEILKNEGEEAARAHIEKNMTQTNTYNLGGVWNEFTE